MVCSNVLRAASLKKPDVSREKSNLNFSELVDGGFCRTAGLEVPSPHWMAAERVPASSWVGIERSNANAWPSAVIA